MVDQDTYLYFPAETLRRGEKIKGFVFKLCVSVANK